MRSDHDYQALNTQDRTLKTKHGMHTMSTSSSHPTKTRSAKWFASTPHGVLERLDDGPTLRPYGTIHGRQPGSGLTACGKYAVDWRIFWEIPFTSGSPRACAGCAEAIARSLDAEGS